MSADEDTELRDLVAQTLEANGTLGKLRAQLRASVFLALEEQEQVQNRAPFLNKKLNSFLSTEDGRLVTGMVREFLDFFHLEFTAAVFDPETGLTEEAESREALAKELNLRTGPGDGEAQSPLLMQLLQGCRSGGSPQQASPSHITRSAALIHPEEDVECNSSPHLPQSLTEKQVEDARKKFEEYDRDGSGAIDKDELRELFMDMFPSFNKNMLERYVNDEFRAVDRDFSSRNYFTITARGIDFEEFLGMYKRLFLQCRTVVSGDVEGILSSVQHPAPLKTGSSQKSVEARKQVKTEKSAPPLPSTPPPHSAGSQNGGHDSLVDDLLGGDDDSFFDDVLPSGGGGMNLFPNSEGDKAGEKKDAGKSGGNKGGSKTAGSSMSSLGDLPFLSSTGTGSTKPTGSKAKDGSSNLRSLDRRMADLGIDNDMQDDFEYEDDFQSSGHSLSQKSPRSKGEGREQAENGSIAEEIDGEEIDEDISIEADDLLKSENSGFEDMTEDHSISQMDGGFDYMEDPQLP
ncbi:uncharacterized protein LOC143298352 isoform X2 [Babylonia areolata]|uniref:uncharacterized protein LOC143298352 isoform X2 n=1 Tax=Babylonia areolata TaxID=304850 RepID=UPI003FD44B34